MKNKKWLLVLIIIFPSFFWFILETSTINSKKLPFYGKKEISIKGDTMYQKINTSFFKIQDTDNSLIPQTLSVKDFGVFALVILNEKYRKDGFRIAGLTEFLTYKKSKIEHIPIVILTPSSEGVSQIEEELKPLQTNHHLHFLTWPVSSYDSLSKSYFINKPYYIDYSFFMLIDHNRNIRGYYDSRYASEIKRLIDEYQHLRLKEEKQKLIQTNEIKINS